MLLEERGKRRWRRLRLKMIFDGFSIGVILKMAEVDRRFGLDLLLHHLPLQMPKQKRKQQP